MKYTQFLFSCPLCDSLRLKFFNITDKYSLVDELDINAS